MIHTASEVVRSTGRMRRTKRQAMRMFVCCDEVLTSQDYILLPVQVDKVVQLYETMMTSSTLWQEG